MDPLESLGFVAGLLTTCVSSICGAGATCRQRIAPVLADTHISSSFFVAVSKEVRKMRSPQTDGDECPTGKAVFHFAVPNLAGGAASEAATPVAFGPRNCGQSAAKATEAAIRKASARIAGLYRVFPPTGPKSERAASCVTPLEH